MQVTALLAAIVLGGSPGTDSEVFATKPTKDASNESTPERSLAGATKVLATFTDSIKIRSVNPGTEMNVVLPHMPLMPNQEKIGETYFEIQNLQVLNHYTKETPNGKFEVFRGIPTGRGDIIGKAITKLWVWPLTVYGSTPPNFPGAIQVSGTTPGGDYTDPAFQSFLGKNGLNDPIDSAEVKLKKFYAHLAKNYNYDSVVEKGDLDVKNLINRKTMGCMSTSLLTVAYLRSQGVNAFTIRGMVITPGKQPLPHAQVCANIGSRGWVTLDPTYAMSSKNLSATNAGHYFIGGLITNKYDLFGEDKQYIARVGTILDFIAYGMLKGGGGFNASEDVLGVQLTVLK